MAITITALTSSYDNVDRTVYTTASISPTASRWLVVDSFARGPDPVPSDATVAGLSLTWTQEGSGDAGSILRINRHYAWTGASPGSGTITLTYSVSALGAGWVIYEVNGANASDPFVQTIANVTSNPPATSVSVTLAAFGNAANRPLISAFHNATEASTEDSTPSAYTELADVSGGSPNAGFAVAWNSANTDTTPSYSWTTSSSLYAAIASEIADAGAAGGTSLDPFGMSGFFGG
jgi:hypothetical protein